MIFIDIEEIGWRPYIEIWLQKPGFAKIRKTLQECVEKYFERLLTVKHVKCKELVKASDFACLIAMTRLFNAQALQTTF